MRQETQRDEWVSIYRAAGRLLADVAAVTGWVREGKLEARESTDGRPLEISVRSLERFLGRKFRREDWNGADHSVEDENSAAGPFSGVGPGWPFVRGGV